MKRAMLFLLSILASPLFSPAQADVSQFSSTGSRATLLELYTSEGCSSCPPADRWLSQLKQNPQLWKELFPIAFHVDYWNYLGWKDVFSDNRHSLRQQRYAALGHTHTVYTPGFFQNGREWRGWFQKQGLVLDKSPKVGTLSATIDQGEITATFKPTNELKVSHLNIAVLGFNKTTAIRAGENRGKKLQHDFVVLSHRQYQSNNNTWRISDDSFASKIKTGNAILFWVAQNGDPTPIQTTGGWLGKQ